MRANIFCFEIFKVMRLISTALFSFVARLGSFLSNVLTGSAPFVSLDNQHDAKLNRGDETATRQATVSHKSNCSSKILSNLASTQLNSAGSSRTILIVAHGAAISALVGTLLLEMGLATTVAGIQRTRIWNCSITEVSVDVSHLPIRDEKVDVQQLIEEASRKAFVIERWAGESHNRVRRAIFAC